MDYTISLSLKNGNQVIPSTKTVRVSPGDTIAFVSNDGDVDITFEPPNAVQLDPTLGCKRVTVKTAPFGFSCKLKTPDGKEVGWGQAGAGGAGEPNPPH